MLVKIPSPFDDFGFYSLGFLVNAGTKLGLTEGSSSNKEEGQDDFFHGVYGRVMGKWLIFLQLVNLFCG
jgi:hypothetical protein